MMDAFGLAHFLLFIDNPRSLHREWSHPKQAGLPTLVNLLKIIPHRPAQRLDAHVILELINLKLRLAITVPKWRVQTQRQRALAEVWGGGMEREALARLRS